MKTRKTILSCIIAIAFLSIGISNHVAANNGDWPIRVVRYYPNPASSQITFEFKKESTLDRQVNFQVYNFLGKKMVDIPLLSNRFSINLESFYRGLYVFQLRDKSGNILESGKFQIVK